MKFEITQKQRKMIDRKVKEFSSKNKYVVFTVENCSSLRFIEDRIREEAGDYSVYSENIEIFYDNGDGVLEIQVSVKPKEKDIELFREHLENSESMKFYRLQKLREDVEELEIEIER